MRTLVKENPRENVVDDPKVKGFRGLDGVVTFQFPYKHIPSMSGVSASLDALSDYLCGLEAGGVGNVKTKVHRDNFMAMDMLEKIGFTPVNQNDYTQSWLVWRLELIHTS